MIMKHCLYKVDQRLPDLRRRRSTNLKACGRRRFKLSYLDTL